MCEGLLELASSGGKKAPISNAHNPNSKWIFLFVSGALKSFVRPFNGVDYCEGEERGDGIEYGRGRRRARAFL